MRDERLIQELDQQAPILPCAPTAFEARFQLTQHSCGENDGLGHCESIQDPLVSVTKMGVSRSVEN